MGFQPAKRSFVYDLRLVRRLLQITVVDLQEQLFYVLDHSALSRAWVLVDQMVKKLEADDRGDVETFYYPEGAWAAEEDGLGT